MRLNYHKQVLLRIQSPFLVSSFSSFVLHLHSCPNEKEGVGVLIGKNKQEILKKETEEQKEDGSRFHSRSCQPSQHVMFQA